MKNLMLFFAVGLIAFTSCDKDSDPQPDPMVGTWVGDEVQFIVFAENGTDTIQNLMISLDEPNFAQTVLRGDGSFTSEVRIEEPIEVSENIQGKYRISGSNLILEVEGRENMNVPFTLNGNILTATLGATGQTELKYRFHKE